MPALPAGSTRRRAAIGALGLGTVATLLGPGRRVRAALPPTATLLVPGPETGGFVVWARRLADLLARGTGQAGGTAAVRLDFEILGGPDGVTAANRFTTSAAPDGRTLLVLAGAAAQARLVGDARARFDPAGWLPVCAAQVPVVLALRAGSPVPAPGAPPLRLALGSADGGRAAALLALDLLGIAAEPVLGLDGVRAEEAFRAGAVDAVLLTGGAPPERFEGLQARPWLRLDAGGGAWEGLPQDLPDAHARLRSAPAPLLAGFRSAVTALSLPATLVLPALTGADRVALWRGAARRWIEEESRAAAAGFRLLAGPEAAPLLAVLAAPPPEAVSAYQDWLRRRLGWKPG